MKIPTSPYKYLPLASKRYRRYIDGSKSTQNNVPKSDFLQKSELFTHGTYGGLLFDPRWKSKRQEILIRDHQQCVICQSKEKLQVHHRQYHFISSSNQFKPPWDYANHLLITLCAQCHQRGHQKYKVPTIKL